ncbi:hypothetical protein ACN47E_006918 [Coniothyrium glycines]
MVQLTASVLTGLIAATAATPAGPTFKQASPSTLSKAASTKATADNNWHIGCDKNSHCSYYQGAASATATSSALRPRHGAACGDCALNPEKCTGCEFYCENCDHYWCQSAGGSIPCIDVEPDRKRSLANATSQTWTTFQLPEVEASLQFGCRECVNESSSACKCLPSPSCLNCDRFECSAEGFVDHTCISVPIGLYDLFTAHPSKGLTHTFTNSSSQNPVQASNHSTHTRNIGINATTTPTKALGATIKILRRETKHSKDNTANSLRVSPKSEHGAVPTYSYENAGHAKLQDCIQQCYKEDWERHPETTSQYSAPTYSKYSPPATSKYSLPTTSKYSAPTTRKPTYASTTSAVYDSHHTKALRNPGESPELSGCIEWCHSEHFPVANHHHDVPVSEKPFPYFEFDASECIDCDEEDACNECDWQFRCGLKKKCYHNGARDILEVCYEKGEKCHKV